MSWETPSYVELNMSAEIGAYQDDLERRESPPPIARPSPADEPAAAAAAAA